MFKKSNRNFRLKKAESDESDEEEKKALEEAKVENQARNEEKIKAKVLSFKDEMITADGDESLSNEAADDDGGEFKVKKSRESRRIAKEMKKLRREKEKQQQQQEKRDFNVPAPIVFNRNVVGSSASSAATGKVDDQVKVDKAKYLVNKYGNSNEDEDEDEEKDVKSDKSSESGNENGGNDDEDHDEKLRKLRQEMEILNGDDVDTVENETDEEKRSMKLMLKSGIIPDASAIHAARKKREMARQEADYIPLSRAENTIKYKNEKSRLIREDDEADLSDYEEENRKNGASGKSESRLSMNYRDKEQRERQTIRDNFLAIEQGSDEEKGSDEENNVQRNQGRGSDVDDDDEEEDEWEKEQLRKVLPTNVDLRRSGKSASTAALRALVTPSDDISAGETIRGGGISRYDTVAYNQGPNQAVSKKELIKKSIRSLEESIKMHEGEHARNEERHKAGEIDYENLKTAKPSLDKQYVYFQEMKAFIRDFIDCYNEKIVEIEKCESKWLALYNQRADKIAARRQEDVRDQTNECSAAKPADPAHQRRMIDRENRRSKRREIREEKMKKLALDDPARFNYNEGLSSDDDETSTDENIFKQKKDDILKQLNETVIEDIVEDFTDYSLILGRFKRWKELSPSTYSNAYVALSLPKLFSPLVRFDLIDWNPLEIDDENCLESRKWFGELIAYSRELNADDLLIVPHLVDKTVLVKLISLAEGVYDPFSTRQSNNFSALLLKCVNDFPTLNSQSANTKKLVEALYARFKQSINQDVFVPLYSRQIIEQKSSDKSKFFHRQFWSCVKLYSNILKWKGIFSDAALKELALDCLFSRYLMISLQNMPLNIKTIYTIEYIVDKMPVEWLKSNMESTNTVSLPQLIGVCRSVRRIADTIHDEEFKAGKIDSHRFKEQIRRIKSLFTRMGAADQAISLANAYEFI